MSLGHNITKYPQQHEEGLLDPLATWKQRNNLEFLDRHWFLLVVMALEVVLVAGLYLYHRWWIKCQQKRARESVVLKLCETFSARLVKRFLPEMSDEAELHLMNQHRFRGMRPKAPGSCLTVGFQDLGLELPNGKRVLAGVTGEFRAGRMCAIMGPSGAGKTTFLNALCGKASYGRTTGKVFINGIERSVADFRRVMGFVPQDDTVHEGLTVGEQIRFSTELRNTRGDSAPRRRLIAEDVLSVMQLEHIQNTVVGGVEKRGISGGQRKRVNIGLELACDPMILFLDEPTSGLDATSSLAVVDSLKRMTQLGTTTVMVVHQPRAGLFRLFDDVLLLGKGGRTVYQGPASAAQQYFESLGFKMPLAENPADWFMDVISGDVPNSRMESFRVEMLFDLWEKHKQHEDVSAASRVFERHLTHRSSSSLASLDEVSHLKTFPWTEALSIAKRVNDDWSGISSPSKDNESVLLDEDLEELLIRVSKRFNSDGESVRAEEAVEACLTDDSEESALIRQQAVQELLRRIAGPGKNQATKQELIAFLVGLGGVCAKDKGLWQDRHGTTSREVAVTVSAELGAKAARGFAQKAARALSLGSFLSMASTSGSTSSLPAQGKTVLSTICYMLRFASSPFQSNAVTSRESDSSEASIDTYTAGISHALGYVSECNSSVAIECEDRIFPDSIALTIRPASVDANEHRLGSLVSALQEGAGQAVLETDIPSARHLVVARERDVERTPLTPRTPKSARTPVTPRTPRTPRVMTRQASVPSFLHRIFASPTLSSSSLDSSVENVIIIPGFWWQLGVLSVRSSIQWWRNNQNRLIFLGITICAASVLAIMDAFVQHQPEWEVTPMLSLHTCFALLTCIFCLGVFGSERPVFWRESASGLSVLAFFISKTTIDLADLILQCFTFASCYYLVRQPLHPFDLYFLPFPLISWASSGMGYFISTVLPPHHGPFVGSIVSFISCGLLGDPSRILAMQQTSVVLEVISDAFSITRWSVAYYFLKFKETTLSKFQVDQQAEIEIRYVQDIYTTKSIVPATLGPLRTEIVFLLAMGAFWRLAAFLGLILANRNKRQ